MKCRASSRIRPRDLPRVSARDGRGVTRAARLLARYRGGRDALGEPDHRATLDGVDVSALREGTRGRRRVSRFSRAGTRGRLWSMRPSYSGDRPRRLGGDVRAPASARAPRAGERGVVAGIVASCARARGAVSISLFGAHGGRVGERVVHGRDQDAGASCGVAIKLGHCRGCQRLGSPRGAPRWLRGGRAARRARRRARRPRVRVRVELARTSLAAGVLAAVVAGDAVVSDGEPSSRLRPAAGRCASRATFAAAGGRRGWRVTLEGEFRPTPTPVAAWPAAREKSSPGDVTTGDAHAERTKDRRRRTRR